MNKKLYCINCKYYHNAGYVEGLGGFPSRCSKLVRTDIIEDAPEFPYKKKIYVNDCNGRFYTNRSNNCKHYKRKWWKIWI